MFHLNHLSKQFRNTSILILHHHLWQRYPNNGRYTLVGGTTKRLQTTEKKRNKPKRKLITLREKKRLLTDQNLIREDSLSWRSANDFLDVAKGRISYFKTKLYQHWNPEYDPANPPPIHIHGPIMDARWWFWNIVMALTPAALLGIYCEFVVQPDMHQFFMEQELKHMKITMGDEYFEAHKDEIFVPAPDNIVVKMYKGAREAIQYIMAFFSAEDTNGQQQTPARPADNETTKKATTEEVVPTKPMTHAQSTPGTDASVQALLERIHILEKKLGIENTSDDKTQGLWTPEYQKERLHQSGPNNRRDDLQLQRWKEAAAAHSEEHHRESSAVTHRDDSGVDASKQQGLVKALYKQVQQISSSLLRQINQALQHKDEKQTENKVDEESHSPDSQNKDREIPQPESVPSKRRWWGLW